MNNDPAQAATFDPWNHYISMFKSVGLLILDKAISVALGIGVSIAAIWWSHVASVTFWYDYPHYLSQTSGVFLMLLGSMLPWSLLFLRLTLWRWFVPGYLAGSVIAFGAELVFAFQSAPIATQFRVHLIGIALLANFIGAVFWIGLLRTLQFYVAAKKQG